MINAWGRKVTSFFGCPYKELDTIFGRLETLARDDFEYVRFRNRESLEVARGRFPRRKEAKAARGASTGDKY